jgi:hypothetical protein
VDISIIRRALVHIYYMITEFVDSKNVDLVVQLGKMGTQRCKFVGVEIVS